MQFSKSVGAGTRPVPWEFLWNSVGTESPQLPEVPVELRKRNACPKGQPDSLTAEQCVAWLHSKVISGEIDNSLGTSRG